MDFALSVRNFGKSFESIVSHSLSLGMFQILALCLTCSLAAPPTYTSRSLDTSYSSSPNVAILKQIHQANDDGTYTFGYEAADGSFRVENRDADGYVTGKYGYVDANGKLQEFGTQPTFKTTKYASTV